MLKAGPDPGTMDLALKVDDHLPLHGSVDLNNQYTPDTDSLRATFALSYDNLFNELDSLAAQYTMTPQKTGQVGVFNTSYAFRPLGPGITPSISFTDSKSNVATIGTLGVLGDGQVVGARISFPLVQLPGDMQSLTLGLDYKHFRNTINLDSSGAQSSSGSLIEPISYVNASLAYARRVAAGRTVGRRATDRIVRNHGQCRPARPGQRDREFRQHPLHGARQLRLSALGRLVHDAPSGGLSSSLCRAPDRPRRIRWSCTSRTPSPGRTACAATWKPKCSRTRP